MISHVDSEVLKFFSRQDHCHYFLVLETDAGTTLLTEKLSDGTVQMLIQPAPWSHKTHWCWDVGFTFFKHYWMDPWLMLHFLLWSTASSEFFRAGRSQSVFQKHFGYHGAIWVSTLNFRGVVTWMSSQSFWLRKMQRSAFLLLASSTVIKVRTDLW